MKNYLWNMFAAIKNGQLAKRKFVYHRKIKFGEEFLKVLWDEGFISGYSIDNVVPNRMKIFLKYSKTGRPVINSLRTIYKPGKKVTLKLKQIWKIDSTKAFIIFSTNKGLHSIISCKRLGLGGIPYIVVN